MEQPRPALEGLSESTMATAAYLVLDRTPGQSSMVSAGHPPPLLVRPADRRAYV